jgi:hypothetical protein
LEITVVLSEPEGLVVVLVVVPERGGVVGVPTTATGVEADG